MAAFSRQNPLVELSLRTGSSPEIQDLVVKSELEIAAVTNPPSCASLVMEPLREEKLSIFVAPGHPLAKKNRLDLTEISKLPLIIREGKKGSTRIDELIARLCKQKCKLKVQMRCDSPDSVKAAVTKGAGVGILYNDLVKEDVRRGDFKLVKVRGIDLSGTSSVIYSRGKPLSSSAEAFLVLLRDAGTPVRSKT